MNVATIEQIETNVERGAAALFGGAVAYAAFTFLRSLLPAFEVSACAGVAAVPAFLLCSRAMKFAAGGRRPLPVPIFDLRQLDTFEPDELLLTDADRVPGELLLTEADRLRDELLLTDADRISPAEQLVTDCRVVRLFDRKALPTPGELKSRVDDHLGQSSAARAPSDASQALAAALAELRRSLR